MTLGTLLRLVAAIAVLTVITSVIMLIPDWHGVQASLEARDIDRLLEVMIVLSSFVFSVVMVLMGYAIWKFRAKPGDESDGEPIHGNTKVEIIWTVIPTIIVLFGAGYSWVVLNDIEGEAEARTVEVETANGPVEVETDGTPLPIRVTAQQFSWRFDYVDQGVTSTELHAPAGHQLELELVALDVIHSFWVPEWRIKRDLVPGAQLPEGDQIDNVVHVTPTRPGTYAVVCAELCGLGHATMRAPAIVHETMEQFEAWAADQQEIPDAPHTGPAGGRGAGSIADPELFPQPED